jgi:hypothetical protein
MLLDLERFRSTEASNDPFPHVVVQRFLRPEAFATVYADLPEFAKGGSFPISSIRLGPKAKEVLTELEGPAFRAAVAEKFGLDLSDAATMTTLRGHSREKDGRIHSDSKAKRVTILLYLNPTSSSWTDHQGCLRLLRQPNSLDDYMAEVPPVDGTLLVFPNSDTAWHGHKQFVGKRYVMQMNYMTADDAARSEQRRYRISAFLKRLT